MDLKSSRHTSTNPPPFDLSGRLIANGNRKQINVKLTSIILQIFDNCLQKLYHLIMKIINGEA